MLGKRVRFLSSGVRKESFALPFNGGTIWYEHLDALGSDQAAFRSKLSTDMTELAKPSAPSHIAVIVDETEITAALSALLVQALTTQAHPKRVAFVGMSLWEKRRTRALLRKIEPPFPVSFHGDLEQAKHWLIP
ncbi:hypothetical protein LJC74_06760 [Eubacteriales bacterium OttesenSCG-928-A19]|nr:hypothetical protein [Eubacteriales bacterium OttesenSCG-928-A19]